MIKAEEFENCILIAVKNNVDALAHFSIGMGGRTQDLIKISAVLVVPLDKNGFLEPSKNEAIEKMKSSKSIAELQEVCRSSGIVWISGG